MLDILFDFLNKRNVYYEKNFDIKKISSIKIGGRASAIIYPKAQNELISVVDFLVDNNITYKTIGRMSNILPSDENINTILLSTAKFNHTDTNGFSVTCESGAILAQVLIKLAHSGLGGAEALISIPGSVGGMLYSNAGAYGSEISDFVKRVSIYDISSKQVIFLTKDDLQFGYRTSKLKIMNCIVLNAEFQLFKINIEEIFQRMKHFKEQRRQKQPLGYPSLGSIFKKCNEYSAGELIDRCGLKGKRIGGAMISEKHAGFIINYHNATADDVKSLINLAEDSVFLNFGIRLEKEIEYL